MRQLKITQQITSRESISLTKYLNDISPLSLVSADEEIVLAKKIQAGDEIALKTLVEANLRFVVSVAKQYISSRERLDDLINAGNEGLIVAARRFDHSKGFKFISYAVWWIRQSIMQHLTENGRAIRLPSNKITLVNKIRNATSYLEQNLQRVPMSEEIVDELFKISGEKYSEKILKNDSTKKFKKEPKLEISDIEQILRVDVPVASLDMPLGEDSDSTLVDLIITDTVGDISELMKNKDLQLTVRRVIEKKLSAREQEVITLNFGLFGCHQKTLDEIGFKLELTRERVRQIKDKAIKKLKNSSSSKLMREYV